MKDTQGCSWCILYSFQDLALLANGHDSSSDDSSDSSDDSDTDWSNRFGPVTADSMKLPGSAGKNKPIIQEVTVEKSDNEQEDGVPWQSHHRISLA